MRLVTSYSRSVCFPTKGVGSCGTAIKIPAQVVAVLLALVGECPRGLGVVPQQEQVGGCLQVPVEACPLERAAAYPQVLAEDCQQAPEEAYLLAPEADYPPVQVVGCLRELGAECPQARLPT